MHGQLFPFFCNRLSIVKHEEHSFRLAPVQVKQLKWHGKQFATSGISKYLYLQSHVLSFIFKTLDIVSSHEMQKEGLSLHSLQE